MFFLFFMIGFGDNQPYFDEGRLEFNYFSQELLPFRECDPIDFLWVKPGFELKGKSLQFQSLEVCDPFLGEDGDGRDMDDRGLAKGVARNFSLYFKSGFEKSYKGKIQFVESGGDILVQGRIVDASTGNEAAKYFVGFGVGAGNVVLDLKFIDAKSGELLMAVHHRVVSGTNFSSSNSKLQKWLKKWGKTSYIQGESSLYGTGQAPKQDHPKKD